MLQNNFRIAWRNLKTHRLFSFLNIFGLSIGLAISILLYMFIVSELSFDTMYKNEKNTYRILVNSKAYGNMATAPNAVAPALIKNLPDVKFAARMLKHGFGTSAFIEVNHNHFIEKSLYWCDPSIFEIFDVPFLAGNPANALNRPNTVALSESAAQKYFGTHANNYQSIIGKTIKVDNEKTLEVTGVYKDFANNSTIDCDVIGSYSSTGFSKRDSWSNASFETYCVLNQHADMNTAQHKMNALLDKNVAKDDRWFTLSLQPLAKVHLYSSDYINSYSSRDGDIREVRNLGLLVALILLIACINYMNLATARSQKKAKDVAINKTLGASARNLVLRFYIETAVLSFIALLLGIFIAGVTLPLFNNITGKHLEVSMLLNLRFSAAIIIMWLVITFISGSYPALYLSRFSPKLAMQQSFSVGSFSSVVRKGLVVVQFASSVILIIGVVVIYQQMKFVRNKNLGFQPENVIAVNTSGAENDQQVSALINELKMQPDVLSVAGAQGFPGMDLSARSIYKNEADEEGLNLQTNHSSRGIIDVLKLKLLAGSDLPAHKAAGDSTVQVILNKKAVDYLGLTPQEAVGKKVMVQLGNNAYITGVVDNFNFASLHEPIGAYAFHNSSLEPETFLLVRFTSGNIPGFMKDFQKLFKETIPNSAFDYTFLDNYMNSLYASEKKMETVVIIFSILAIFVACMGLFGLASFTAEQRTKEIGIRKVLGASVSGISTLLSKDFLKLVILSIVVAAPVAWWVMNIWLESFAYRIQISWWMFAFAGLVAVLIGLITVSFQAIKAAVANPVKSLRSE